MAALRGYSFRDVLQATGATRSQLIHWTDVSLITSDIARTAGTGHPRRFSFRNLVEVRLTVVLAAYGLRVDELRFVLTHVRGVLRQRRRTRDFLLVLGGDLADPKMWIGTRAEFSAESRQPLFLSHAGVFVNLGAVIETLEESTHDRW